MFKMIGKLLGFSLKSYAVLSTTLVLSQLVLLVTLWGKGFLDGQKIERLKAVYTDVDYQAIRIGLIEKDIQKKQDPDRLAETETIKTRQDSIDRMANRVALSEVQLREEGRRFELLEEAFTNEVVSLEKQIMASTRGQLMNTLKNMDSQQVKDSLVGIVRNGGLEDVLQVLRQMSNTEQAKIFAEFQTDEEKQLLNEILRSIRNQ